MTDTEDASIAVLS